MQEHYGATCTCRYSFSDMVDELNAALNGVNLHTVSMFCVLNHVFMCLCAINEHCDCVYF